MNRLTSLNPSYTGPTPHKLYRYELVAQTLFQPELGQYCTYGIRISTPAYSQALPDVSPCKNTAQTIVKHLNRHQVSPVHFYDVVADLLG